MLHRPDFRGSLISAVAVLALLGAATIATAVPLSLPFLVPIDSGDLAGQAFAGEVTFDTTDLGALDPVVLFPGEFSLTFEFLGGAFTEDDDFAFFATAEIAPNATLLGLGYTVDSLGAPNAFFGFTPSDASIGDDFFYELFDEFGFVVDDGAGRLVARTPTAGDYNDSGGVNAADYTTWRDALDLTPNLIADGDGNQAIGPGDFAVWSGNYGSARADRPIPEPSAAALAVASLGVAGALRSKR